MQIPSAAFVNQAARLAEDADTLRLIHDAVGYANDLSRAQATHWYAVALEYQPTLIIELGRGRGNSTTIWTAAANRMSGLRIKSFCNSSDWVELTRPALERVRGPSWFEPLEIHGGDITQIDFAPHIGDAGRVLLLWDAHGFAVADAVLGGLLPLLADREHLVICHDVSDNRLFGGDFGRSYEGQTFWRGMDSHYAAGGRMTRTNLFWLNTIVDQFIPILDFCFRNYVELHSADWEVKQEIMDRPEVAQAVTSVVPPDLFNSANHWAYFTLNESDQPRCFPAKFA